MAAAGKSYADGPMQAFVPASRPGTNRLPGGACVPPFLEAWKFKILLAGKYLNVIKECGVEIADWEQQDRKVAEQSEGALVRMDQPKSVISCVDKSRRADGEKPPDRIATGFTSVSKPLTSTRTKLCST